VSHAWTPLELHADERWLLVVACGYVCVAGIIRANVGVQGARAAHSKGHVAGSTGFGCRVQGVGCKVQC
jgi:hypothetical protein